MKKDRRQKLGERRLFRDRVFTIITSVIVIAMLVTLAVLIRQKSTQPSETDDYEGTIVDRWAGYGETTEGSRARFALVVESRDGKRFTVKVDPNVYESLRAIVKKRKTLVFIDPLHA